MQIPSIRTALRLTAAALVGTFVAAQTARAGDGPNADFVGQVVAGIENNTFTHENPLQWTDAHGAVTTYKLNAIILFALDAKYRGKHMPGGVTCALLDDVTDSEHKTTNAFCITNWVTAQSDTTISLRPGNSGLATVMLDLQNGIYAPTLKTIAPTNGYLVAGSFDTEYRKAADTPNEEICRAPVTDYWFVGGKPAHPMPTTPTNYNGVGQACVFSNPPEPALPNIQPRKSGPAGFGELQLRYFLVSRFG